jgi:hypothetical protein
MQLLEHGVSALRNLRNGADMATKPDELLPTAKDFMQKLALAEAEEDSHNGGTDGNAALV